MLGKFLARPERLELPTYWLEASGVPRINNLAGMLRMPQANIFTTSEWSNITPYHRVHAGGGYKFGCTATWLYLA